MDKPGKNLVPPRMRAFVPEDIDLANPEKVEDLFKSLEARSLSSARELEQWLLDWSELAAALREEEASRYIRFTIKTDDPEREKDYLWFAEKITPLVKAGSFRLARKFVSSPARAELPPERYFPLTRELENQVRIFREENLPLQVEEEKLTQQYQKIAGAMTVEHEGREQTLQQMARYLEEPDRQTRKTAWEKITGRRLQDKEALEDLFDELLELRQKIAQNAGFENYRDYAFRLRSRFDYGAPECKQFHAAAEKLATPLHRAIQEQRKKKMGLARLRPWDLKPDPEGKPPLRPFQEVSELVEGCAKIFEKLDPELGRWFRFMEEHELLDLESRKGKAPGAYSHSLDELRVPFIFANAAGMDSDLETLLHEAGHSFHTFETREEPLVFYRHAPLEFAEVASMAMEFLAGRHREVFYSKEDAERSMRNHLEGVVWLFTWVATVDAFQHWLYTHPGHSRKERAEAWRALRKRFGGIEDWEGYEDALLFEWHRQIHIFEYPFYYIEYGVAELGAMQVWRRSLENLAAAVKDYRAALRLGGSRPLPDLFQAAGCVFDFGEKTMKPLMEAAKAALLF